MAGSARVVSAAITATTRTALPNQKRGLESRLRTVASPCHPSPLRVVRHRVRLASHEAPAQANTMTTTNSPSPS